MQQRTRSLPPDGTHLNIVTSSCPLTPRYWPSTKTCGTESNTDSSAWQFELLLVLLFMFDVGDRPTTAPPIVRRVSIRSLSSLWWPLSKKIPLRRQAFSHFVDNQRIIYWLTGFLRFLVHGFLRFDILRQRISSCGKTYMVTRLPRRLLYRMKLLSNFGVYSESVTKKMEHIWWSISRCQSYFQWQVISWVPLK